MSSSSPGRLRACALAVLLLLVLLVCVLPRFLPGASTFFGVLDADGNPLTHVPLGSGDLEVGISSTYVGIFPRMRLLINGEDAGDVHAGEVTPLTLPASWFETPGTMEFILEYRLLPGVTVRSNSALIEVGT